MKDSPVKISLNSIIQPISFKKAMRYSPWPSRILGREKWNKKTRKQEDVIKEYNDGWYKEALDYYKSNRILYTKKRNPNGAVIFLYSFEKQMMKRMKNIKRVYGEVSEAKGLISFGERFYLGDLFLINLGISHPTD